ncbi:MAG TPA: redoxin domain-containing protein [Solirubrobacteraceae bacterium]|nr:redoxin domain-containing protein [Solirubrobacteraceae bacterium]
MRSPVDHIAAPELPLGLPWFGGGPLSMGDLRGRPVLIEFWDFCRPNSVRTLPYLKGWHERYAPRGLQVIGVHTSGFAPSADPSAVQAGVARLQIPYPVVVDVQYEIWGLYGNLGWPARYLFNQKGMLFEQHYGEGAYDETERAIQELLGLEEPLLDPLRPEDAPGAVLEPQSEDVEGPYSGPYWAGGVWAVLEGSGWVTVNGRRLNVSGPGCYELISHPKSTAGQLQLELGPGVSCHAVCFTPGLA